MAAMTMRWWRSRTMSRITAENCRRSDFSWLKIWCDCPAEQRDHGVLLALQGQGVPSPGTHQSDVQGVEHGLGQELDMGEQGPLT